MSVYRRGIEAIMRLAMFSYLLCHVVYSAFVSIRKEVFIVRILCLLSNRRSEIKQQSLEVTIDGVAMAMLRHLTVVKV